MAYPTQSGTLLAIARRSGKRAPMETLSKCLVTTSSGIEGDSRGKPGKRQVTVLSASAWQNACNDINQPDLPWTTRRANLLIDGFEFKEQDLGAELYIGKVVLLITRETDPCERMDEQQPGLTQALMPDWRGGVCCRVLVGGEIHLDDPVRLKKSEQQTLDI